MIKTALNDCPYRRRRSNKKSRRLPGIDAEVAKSYVVLTEGSLPLTEPNKSYLLNGAVAMPLLQLPNTEDVEPSAVPLLSRAFDDRQVVLYRGVAMPLKRKCEGGSDSWDICSTETARKRRFVFSYEEDDLSSWLDDMWSLCTPPDADSGQNFARCFVPRRQPTPIRALFS